jgi:peroxiredoxin
VRGELNAIRAKGAELVVVGNGSPWFAAAFRDELALDFPLLVDTGLAAYRAAGLRRSVVDTLRPAALLHAVRAWKSGARQSAVKGDPWQLGGAFVVAKGGRVLFRHVSREAGDHAPVADLVAAIPEGWASRA